jgi:hypothetical protein
MTLTEYHISLHKNEWKELPQTHFKHSTDGKLASQETNVKLKYDDDFIYVEFECHQNPFWKENTYKIHNDHIWNQEVFELFISDELAGTPKHYLEFEINPINTIWVGRIHNPTGKAPKVPDTEMIPIEKTGIKYQANAKGDIWSGSFQIPFKLIGKKQNRYKINFYRIISKQSHPNKDWKGNPSTCDYTCWSPTMAGKTPAFHRPAYFGELVLE